MRWNNVVTTTGSVQLELETVANLLATAMKSLVPGREARQTLERLAEDG